MLPRPNLSLILPPKRRRALHDSLPIRRLIRFDIDLALVTRVNIYVSGDVP